MKCFAASDDVELTDVGRQQAHDLAQTIRKRFHPTRIYSSLLTRARQTAAILGDELGLEVTELPGIHERNFGCLRAQPYRHLGAMMRADPAYDPARRWLWVPEGGESLDQVRARAMEALLRTASICDGEEVVVVSHGAVMECVTAAVSGDWDSASVPENCGVLVLEYEAPPLSKYQGTFTTTIR
jgi:broad specificity phosphatase PhoE